MIPLRLHTHPLPDVQRWPYVDRSSSDPRRACTLAWDSGQRAPRTVLLEWDDGQTLEIDVRDNPRLTVRLARGFLREES